MLPLRERELRGPPAHLLTERERRRVHHVRAPDLHDAVERTRPSPRSALRSALDGTAGAARERAAATARCITVGNTSFDDCDMFTWSFGCTGPGVPSGVPSELVRAVRDDLVGVHVRLRAAAGLPDDERELIVELARDHLVGRATITLGALRVELAERRGSRSRQPSSRRRARE